MAQTRRRNDVLQPWASSSGTRKSLQQQGSGKQGQGSEGLTPPQPTPRGLFILSVTGPGWAG